MPLIVLLGTACSGSSSGSSPHPSPAETLSSLAATAATLSYSATYGFHEADNDQNATVQVWRAQPSLRVDVVVGTTTASLIVGPAATYSCAITPRGRSCLTVAAAGQPLPAPFNVAPTSLFTVDVQTLATNISDYSVTAAPPVTATGNAPAGSCFDVTPLETPAVSASPSPNASAMSTALASTTSAPSTAGVVPRGTYCFSDTGLLTAATYPSGNTVRLQSGQVASPPAVQFSPYAKPTPLPTR